MEIRACEAKFTLHQLPHLLCLQGKAQSHRGTQDNQARGKAGSRRFSRGIRLPLQEPHCDGVRVGEVPCIEEVSLSMFPHESLQPRGPRCICFVARDDPSYRFIAPLIQQLECRNLHGNGHQCKRLHRFLITSCNNQYQPCACDIRNFLSMPRGFCNS